MSTPKKNDIYKAEEKQTSAGTDNLTLKGDVVPKGAVVEITFIAIKDETTSGKTVRIGYERACTQYWVVEEPAGTNYHGVTFTGTMHLVEDERPIGMVESPTASDVIKFFARGKYL